MPVEANRDGPEARRLARVAAMPQSRHNAFAMARQRRPRVMRLPLESEPNARHARSALQKIFWCEDGRGRAKKFRPRRKVRISATRMPQQEPKALNRAVHRVGHG